MSFSPARTNLALKLLTGHIVPSLTSTSLIRIQPLFKAGCKVLFNNKKCKVLYKYNVILMGYKDPSTNLWTLPIPTKRVWTTLPLHTHDAQPPCQAHRSANLPCNGPEQPSPCVVWGPFMMSLPLPQPPCVGHAPHLQRLEPAIHARVNIRTFTHSMRTRTNTIKFAHQSLDNPKLSTLLKAMHQGFRKGCPNISKLLIPQYLNQNPKRAKAHMKCPHHGIRSTQPKAPRLMPIPTITDAP
jgi:hypothetical protein